MAAREAIDETRLPDREVIRRGAALVARQVRRARHEFTIGGAGTVVFALATIGSSYVIGWATDHVLVPSVKRGEVTTATLVGAALAVLGVSLLRAAGITFRRIGAYSAQYRLQARDRTDVVDRYLELPLEWHRTQPTGKLLSNVNADVEASSVIAAPLPMAFGVTVMLAVTTVLLVSTDWYLAAIGFLVLPAILLSNIAYQRRMRVVAAQAQQLRAEVAEIAHESFDAALVVKTLGREDAEVGRFGSRSEDLRDRMVEVGRIRAMFDPLMEALPTLGVLAVLGVGAWRVEQGLLTPGNLVTFAYLFRLIALPMRVFGWLLGDMPTALVGWERIEKVLDEPGTVRYGDRPLAGSGAAGAEVERASYRYQTEDEQPRGVEEIVFGVRPGATVALVGPTGSGKTTVAQLLVRLFDPEQGEVRLDGTDLMQIERSSLARSSALVFQEAFLFDDTVHNNITLGEDFTTGQVVDAARLAQADGFISTLPDGYQTLVGERGTSLSGGQRQRIALARALIRTPRLLVLDDATSAVDPAVEAEILQGLAALSTTVVIVAYRRSSILLADEVVFVEDGRVTGRGTHSELMESLPAYRRLLEAYEQGGTPDE